MTPSFDRRRSRMIWQSSAQSRGSLKTNTASILREFEGLAGSIGRGTGRVLLS
jgi:hypothetical protein